MHLPLDIEHQQFIAEHCGDDIAILMLNAHRYRDIDMAFAVDQIDIRKRLRDKLPEWCANRAVVFPSRIASEQCSSSQTARYKSSLLIGETLCDMTGGMGVDSYFFAQKAKHVTYIERSEEYCQCAEANFNALNTLNITVKCGDCSQMIDDLSADTFFIDPARRSNCNKRLFALADCQPDIVSLRSAILSRAKRLIVKVSPMADITETIRQLPETTEIHIISVNNECREILFILENEPHTPIVKAINFVKQDTFTAFHFTFGDENGIDIAYASKPNNYLYEPNASIMKSGAFKLVAQRTDTQKLDVHSHLYTSEIAITDFPGRVFKVVKTIDFSSRNIRDLSKQITKANISTRNFPITTDELRKKLGIAEGGNTYLFATTCANSRIIIVCEKI